MRHELHPEALREYDDAAAWYEEQRSGLGGEFSDAIEAAVRTILADPGRFQPLDAGLRIFRLKRFNYHLIYRWSPEKDLIFILAIAHQRRQPDYWRLRH